MRSLPQSLDRAIVAEIDARLEQVEDDHGVDVFWAIESGSRAWGFPSPDSDYDCRFLFRRPAEDYLRLRSLRDVIETPLDEVYDVNGWDLRKALGLLVKGNAVVCEWLRSPIVYSGDALLRDALLALADEIMDPVLLAKHHLHVAERHLAESADGSLKRFFYAMRPAATLRWLRVNPASTIPPMDLPTVLAECDPPTEVVAATSDLIALKAKTRETGVVEPPPLLVDFITAELEAARQLVDAPARSREAAWKRADEFFIATIGGTGD